MRTYTAVDTETRKASHRMAFAVTSLVSIGLFGAFFSTPVKPLMVPANAPQVELYFEQIIPSAPPPPAPEPELRKLVAEESEFAVEEPPLPEIIKEPPPPEVPPVQEPPPVLEPPPVVEPPPPEPVVEPPPEPVVEPPPPPVEELPPPEPPKPVEKPKPKPKPKPRPNANPAPVKNAPAEASSSETTKSNVDIAGEATNAKAKNQLLGLLVGLVEKRKRYPKSSRRAGQEGTAEIVFVISPQGKVLSASLRKSSGFEVLDAASVELGQKIVGTDFGIPNKGLTIAVPIQYKLD